MALINGLHHVTALARDPQQNLNFYAGILGLRLLKKTINFDSPETYHLYYGDESGSPGSILTFFPYADLPSGRPGTGQMTVTSFSIPTQSMSYWTQRLKKYNIPFEGPAGRFEEEYISFRDYDGLPLELVATGHDQRTGWTKGHIKAEHAIKGFYGATLCVEGYERTAGLLTGSMDYTVVGEQGSRFRYESASRGPGTYVDLLCHPEQPRSRPGAGTIHHLAFSTSTDADQVLVREKLLGLRYNVTPVLDRQYFHSIYFREPGNILFEIATNPPGFAVDEHPDQLGRKLMLPEWYEPNRAQIEAGLLPLGEPEL